MPKPVAVFLDKETLHADDLDFSSLESAGRWQWYDTSTEKQVGERIQQAEVVVSNKAPLSRDILNQAPNLKLVVIAATGVNNVDLDTCRDLGIAVYNCQGYGNDSVVQHAFAMIFALANQLAANRQAAFTQWSTASQFCLLQHLPMQLAGKTLGIIGYGALGQKAAEIGRALGMQILIAGRKGMTAADGRTEFNQLLENSDIVSLHCPLNEETKDLIAAKQLSLMKSTALLINTARGGIVNEQDLVDALQAGAIAGAGTDVLSEEPPRNNNPLLDYEGNNLIVTPHMAWSSTTARQTLLEQVAENILHFAQGNGLRRVC